MSNSPDSWFRGAPQGKKRREGRGKRREGRGREGKEGGGRRGSHGMPKSRVGKPSPISQRKWAWSD